MRTTLTIEDSILQRLKEEAQNSGIPLKKAVNLALEIGLRNLHRKESQEKIPMKTYPMGHPRGINFDKALQIASVLEDDETIRKLEVRK